MNAHTPHPASAWARFTAPALLAVALTACGGGGGGGSSPSAGGAATTSVSGVAAKGLLSYAKVTAYGMNADGTANTAQVLGSATTSSTGTYTITGLPPNTPVVLEVTPLPAEGRRPATSMKDEVTGNDITVGVGSGFKLQAVVVLDASGTTSAQITPYTTMAVQLLKSLPKSEGLGAAVKAANASISSAVNVAILDDAPAFDATGAVPQNPAAVKLAAVAQLARQDSTCKALTTDLAKIQCAVDRLKSAVGDAPAAGQALLPGPIASALNTAQDLAEAKAKAADAPLGTVAAVGTGTVLKPVSADLASGVASAKSLIQSLRNTFNALIDRNATDGLVSRAKVVGDAIEGSAVPFNEAGIMAVLRVAEAMTPGNAPATAPADWNPTSDSNRINNETTPVPGAIGGGCTAYTDATFKTESDVLDMRQADFVACRVTYSVAKGGSTGNLAAPDEVNATAVQHLLLATRDRTAAQAGELDQITFKTVLLQQEGTWTAAGGFEPDTYFGGTDLVSGVDRAEGPFNGYRTVVLTRTSRGLDPEDSRFQAYSATALQGELAPSPKQQSWGERNGLPVGFSTVDLTLSSGAVSGSGLTKVPALGSFTLNAKTGGAVLAGFALKDGSYLQTTTPRIGYVNDAGVSQGFAHLVMQATARNGAVVDGTLDLDQFITTVAPSGSRAVPLRAVFSGSVKESAAATQPLFTGTVTASLPGFDANQLTLPDLSSFTQRRVVLDGKLVTAGTRTLGLEGMTVALNAANEGTAQGTYVQSDGTAVRLSLVVTAQVNANTRATFEQLSSGVKLDVQGTASGWPKTVKLLRGTDVVGLVDADAATITYADSSYERF